MNRKGGKNEEPSGIVRSERSLPPQFPYGVRTVGRRHVSHGSLTDIRRRLHLRVGIVFCAVSGIVFLAACGTVNEVVSDTPAVAPLFVPELLEPTYDGEGVAHYDLSIGESRHDYRQTALTDTYSYNGMSVLGPTLRLVTGESVVISVTNELGEITTTHWHGADVPAEDDGGPHSLSRTRLNLGGRLRRDPAGGHPLVSPPCPWVHRRARLPRRGRSDHHRRRQPRRRSAAGHLRRRRHSGHHPGGTSPRMANSTSPSTTATTGTCMPR